MSQCKTFLGKGHTDTINPAIAAKPKADDPVLSLTLELRFPFPTEVTILI